MAAPSLASFRSVLRIAAAGALAVATAATAATAAAPASSPPANPTPGRYVTEHGWGHLHVQATRPGEVDFDIDAVGSNAHECQLQGSARAGAASVDAGDGARCGVRFQPVPGGVDIDADDGDACRRFCGARAWFPGRYLVEPADCGDRARARVRASFEALYKARRYEQAVQVLQPQLGACGRFLDRADDGRLRNDLAVALFHAGRKDECRTVLEPLLRDYPRTEAELREGLPPADFDELLPVAKAAWHNAGLCGAR